MTRNENNEREFCEKIANIILIEFINDYECLLDDIKPTMQPLLDESLEMAERKMCDILEYL